MVYLSSAENCDCKTCKGYYTPKNPNGEIMFGGWKCLCSCHQKKEKKKITKQKSVEKVIIDYINKKIKSLSKEKRKQIIEEIIIDLEIFYLNKKEEN